MIKKKQDEAPAQEDMRAFHAKYRPQTLDKLIGHEDAVTRLKGMLNTGKLPSTLLFTGPASAGKTTLARAFAADVNGKPALQQLDYRELNAASERSIDEMRELISQSKLRPRLKRRIIVIDEAQALLSNAAAAAALLKPLEEPSPGTIWILCSMEPQKFSTDKNGKAMATRAKQFALKPHTDKDLMKQALRIAKGENMKYVMDDERVMLNAIVAASGGEMRTLANIMENVYDYYHGLDEKPKRLKPSVIDEVIRSGESSDDEQAIKYLIGLFTGKFTMVQRALLDVENGFQFINKLLWANSFLLNNAVLNGERHRKVWATPQNKALQSAVGKLTNPPSLGVLAAVNEALVEVKTQASFHATSPEELLSAKGFRLIKNIFGNPEAYVDTKEKRKRKDD